MGNALKFTKLDCTLVKKQSYLMVVMFAIISMYFMSKNEYGFFVSVYMSFAAIILSTIPFNIENNNESGFIYMLPAKVSQKVLGRYLYSLLLCVCAVVLEIIQVVIAKFMFSLDIKNVEYFLMIVLAMSIIIVSLQNLLFYIVGRNNNRQFMSILSLIPGFVFIFGGTAIVENIQENTSKYVNMVEYFFNNIGILSAMIILISLIVFICSVCISSFIIGKREKI